MNILFQSRKTLYTVPGGDTIQLTKTAEYIRREGHQVDISLDFRLDVSTYDIVHVFNLMRPQETYLQVKRAKKSGKPVALSTIYGPYIEFEKKGRGGFSGFLSKRLNFYLVEYLKVLARGILNLEFNRGTLIFLFNGYRRLQRKICQMVDIFLPNSDSEMKRVIGDFDLTGYQHLSIPNAVDLDLFNYQQTQVEEEYQQYQDCILCVARIEERKSQLNIIRALKNLPYRLVLIGKPATNSQNYYHQCQKEGKGKVVFLGHVDHQVLPQFYKLAKVHCLVSWMETPGLSSLEAGVMKTNLVITDKGDTRDYFGDLAYYCEPDRVKSIQRAIMKAYQDPVKKELVTKIIRNYNWETAAKETLKAYQRILD